VNVSWPQVGPGRACSSNCYAWPAQHTAAHKAHHTHGHGRGSMVPHETRGPRALKTARTWSAFSLRHTRLRTWSFTRLDARPPGRGCVSLSNVVPYTQPSSSVLRAGRQAGRQALRRCEAELCGLVECGASHIQPHSSVLRAGGQAGGRAQSWEDSWQRMQEEMEPLLGACSPEALLRAVPQRGPH